MKSKFQAIYWSLSLLFAAFVLMSNNGNPPPARTQAPPASMSTCASSGCHSNMGNFTGDVSVTGLPAQIMPNTSYTLSVVVNNTDGAAVRAGFQLDVIDDSESSVGTFSNPSTGSGIETNNGRNFFEHRGGQNFNNNQASWTVEWTAPASISGNAVQFWTVANIANGNFGTSGDNIVFNMQNTEFAEEVVPVTSIISASTDVACHGESTGSATVIASGGTTPYTYLWSNNATTATASDLAAGTYSVTVTDNAMATSTNTVTINEATDLTIMVTNVTDITCSTTDGNVTVAASGGTPDYTYMWSNGTIGGPNHDLMAGNYTVTVTDNNNCTETLSVDINQDIEIPTVSIAPPELLSCGETMTLDASASTVGANISYFWSANNGGIIVSGGNSLMPIISTAGTYELSVANNANGCLATASVTVQNPDGVALVAVNQTDVSCNSGADGSATVSVEGGVAPYTYAWSTGGTTMTEVNLSAGTYTVTVTGSDNCNSLEVDVLIGEPDALSTIIEVTHETAMGANDGTATITISGGTAPYAGAMNDQIINNNLAPGSYSETITDSNGCSGVFSYSINSFDCGTFASTTTSTDVSCANGEDGTAVVTATQGTEPYTYAWSSGGTEATETGLLSGDYSVTVSDANSCETVTMVTINEPIAIEIVDITIVTATDGQSNGSASVSVSGGTPPYTFEWIINDETVSTQEDLMNAVAGVYVLKVTDSNACMLSSEEITIDNLVGINDLENIEQLSVFPNPTTGRFVLSLALYQSQDVQISVFDVTGKEIMSLAPERILNKNFQLDLSNMASGVYGLKIQVTDDILVQKIIVQ